MLRILTLLLAVAATLAWDPSLNVAEKAAIPHHTRHSFTYPEHNMRLIMQQINGNINRGFSSLSGPSGAGGSNRPVSASLRQAPQQNRGIQSNRGFQSQPLEQSRGFPSSSLGQSRGSEPVRQTRFFNTFPQNSRPGSGPSNSFFSRP